MDVILAEIRVECAGLEVRYRGETEQAAFLSDALVDERATRADWSRVDQLTSSIIGYQTRTASLARQMHVIEECRKSIADLMETNAV